MRLFRTLPCALALCAMLVLFPPTRSEANIVKTGAESLSEQGFMLLKGKSFALVTNHSAMVGKSHLLEVMERHGVQPAVTSSR